MTVIMAKLAHALDPKNFPEEFVTEFIVDISKASPEVAAVLDELGFIPPEVRTEILIDADFANLTLDQVRARIKTETDLIGQMTAATRELTEAEEIRLAAAEGRLARLRNKESELELNVTGNASTELPDLSDKVVGLGEDAEGTRDVFKEAFGEIEGSIDKYHESVADAIPGLLETASAIGDFSDPLQFMVDHAGLASKSLAELLLKGEQMGELEFTLDERKALRAQAALDDLNEKIVELDETIGAHQETIGVWEGRISLVEDVLGSAEDTLTVYEGRLARGEITQEEFNEAVASGEAHRAFANLTTLAERYGLSQEEVNEIQQAGLFIMQRSREGIQDEQLAIARSLPDLAQYIAKHDNLSTSYDNLSDDQKGFLAALKDQAVQTALNTFLMLSFLESLGKIPAGVADKFWESAAAANPAIEAIGRELDIATGDRTVVIGVEMPPSAVGEINFINAQIEKFTAEEAVLRVKLQEDPNNAAVKAELLALRQQIFDLQRAKAIIFLEAQAGTTFEDLEELQDVVIWLNDNNQLVISGDATDVEEALAELAELGIDPKTVLIQSEIDPASTPSQAINDAVPEGGIVVPVRGAAVAAEAPTAPIEIPDQSFTVTADTAPARAEVESLLSYLLETMTTANFYGQSIGYQLDTGVVTGIQDYIQPVYDTNTLFTDNWSTMLKTASLYGNTVGANFDTGIAKGVYAYSPRVESAGNYIGRLLFASAMRAIVARSPSQKGMEVGHSFVQGVIIQMLAERAGAVSAAQSVASGMANAFQRELHAGSSFAFDVAAGAPLAGDGGSAFVARGVPAAPAGGNVFQISFGDMTIPVSGASDPAATAQAVGQAAYDTVWELLYDSLGRLQSQVLVQ
jgi:hypothetical protein